LVPSKQYEEKRIFEEEQINRIKPPNQLVLFAKKQGGVNTSVNLHGKNAPVEKQDLTPVIISIGVIKTCKKACFLCFPGFFETRPN